MKEIRWLLKPYVKYGKLYLIISILFAVIILPLDSVIQVYFPQAVLNLLSSHKDFLVIVFTAIGFESVLLLITLLDDLFNNAYKEAVSVRIRANINREIYEQCCKTRYDYVDNPDYFDKFSWAIKEYANKSTEAVGFIVSGLTLIIWCSSKAGTQTRSRQLSRSSRQRKWPERKSRPSGSVWQRRRIRRRRGRNKEPLTGRKSRSKIGACSYERKKTDPNQPPVCAVRVSLRQGIPGLPSGTGGGPLRKDTLHRGRICKCLFLPCAQLPPS